MNEWIELPIMVNIDCMLKVCLWVQEIVEYVQGHSKEDNRK